MNNGTFLLENISHKLTAFYCVYNLYILFTRKSVIVRNTNQCEKGEKAEDDFEDFINIDFGCLLNMQDIEKLYTVEESSNLKQMKSTFYDNWKLISYGRKIVDFYIHFCQNHEALPQNYFKDNSKVVR